MSKVIAGRSPSSHYTMIPNHLIRNQNLSDSAFRLISWISSHQEGFEISFNSIKLNLGYGREKLRKILKEAEEAFHLVRRKINGEGGLFDWEYHIFLEPADAIAYRKSIGGKAVDGENDHRGQSRSMVEPSVVEPSYGEDPPHIKEQYREDQKEENQNTESPPTPKRGKADRAAAQMDLFPEEKPLLESIGSLPVKAEIVHQTENPSCSSIVPGSFENIEQWDKMTDENLKTWFFQVYQQEKPSNFTEHKEISSDHLRAIKTLCKKYPQDAIARFRDALIWTREQSDAWWRDKQISLSNLMTNGKVAEYADKHATAMKHDRAYRDRVEGKKPSMDKGRSFVVDEAGNQETGAMADIARAYATDPIFRMLMEAGK